jgi:hypothetical protein
LPTLAASNFIPFGFSLECHRNSFGACRRRLSLASGVAHPAQAPPSAARTGAFSGSAHDITALNVPCCKYSSRVSMASPHGVGVPWSMVLFLRPMAARGPARRFPRRVMLSMSVLTTFSNFLIFPSPCFRALLRGILVREYGRNGGWSRLFHYGS